MSKSKVIVEMLNAAAPVIRAHWTDLRHDAAMIDAAGAGDVFLWAPRESGTYIVVVKRAHRWYNERALECFTAMEKQYNAQQWYEITIHETHFECEFEKIALADAEALCKQAAKQAREGQFKVSELHL